MRIRLTGLIRRSVMAVFYSSLGATAVALFVFVYYLNNRTDLAPWHLVDLDEEFQAGAGVETQERRE